MRVRVRVGDMYGNETRRGRREGDGQQQDYETTKRGKRKGRLAESGPHALFSSNAPSPLIRAHVASAWPSSCRPFARHAVRECARRERGEKDKTATTSRVTEMKRHTRSRHARARERDGGDGREEGGGSGEDAQRQKKARDWWEAPLRKKAADEEGMMEEEEDEGRGVEETEWDCWTRMSAAARESAAAVRSSVGETGEQGADMEEESCEGDEAEAEGEEAEE